MCPTSLNFFLNIFFLISDIKDISNGMLNKKYWLRLSNFFKKLILLNPSLKIQTEGTILLDYKFLGDDTKES